MAIWRPADEDRAPKYANIERERRWLVDPARRPPLDAAPWIQVEDRYLDGTRFRLRKLTDGATGEIVYKLTKKYGGPDPLRNAIVTAYLDEREYAVFAELPARPLAKRRHWIEHGGLRWNFDLFEGLLAGLETTEIERPDADSLAALRPPPWAGLEISRDSRYQGGSLAAHGLPEE